MGIITDYEAQVGQLQTNLSTEKDKYRHFRAACLILANYDKKIMQGALELALEQFGAEDNSQICLNRQR